MKSFKTLVDLLSPEEHENYQKTLYPFNLRIVWDKLNERIEENPTYEVFVPFVHYKYKKRTKDGSVGVTTPHKLFISNKGNVLSTRNGCAKLLVRSTDESGYLTISLKIGKISETLLIHRVVGCSFVPMPEHISNPHPQELFVNHKDGNKQNPLSTNLEWTTASGNTSHAYSAGLMTKKFGLDNHLTKPVRGEIIKGKYKGHIFILTGRTMCEKYGFRCEVISSCCKGNASTHRNCKFSFATPDEIETLSHGLDEEMLRDIDSYDPRVRFEILAFNTETKKETVIAGGKDELTKLGFVPCCVSNVMAGRAKSHKGHTFKRLEH